MNHIQNAMREPEKIILSAYEKACEKGKENENINSIRLFPEKWRYGSFGGGVLPGTRRRGAYAHSR